MAALGGHRTGLRGLAGALLVLTVMAAGQAADEPRLLVDLPCDGPMSATVKAAYTALQPRFDISWLKVHEGSPSTREPAAIVASSASKLLGDEKPKLSEFVRKGGGLVFIVAPTEAQAQTNNDFLRPFGVRMVKLPQKNQSVKLLPHAVTLDVRDLPAPAIRYGPHSDALEPIGLQNGFAVAVAGMVGVGRLVILPASLLVAPDELRASDSPQAKLLAQAIAWAAGAGTAAPGTGIGAGEASTVPPVAARLAPKVTLDLPDLPTWTDLAGALTTQLTALSMPVEPLGYVKGKTTLATSLPARPALLVLGPSRDFEDGELAALAEYVRGGGSLLVVGYGDKTTVKQISALNKALGEFGISYTLGRPAGQGVMKPHPITQGLTQPGLVASGGAVWAFADWPLLMVDTCTVASAHEFQQGRIVVIDGAALLPSADKQANSNVWFGGLLRNALKWLTGR